MQHVSNNAMACTFSFLARKMSVKEQPNLIYFSTIWVWLEYKTVSTKPLVICQTDPLKLLHISHFLQTMKPPLGLKPTRKRLQTAILGVAAWAWLKNWVNPCKATCYNRIKKKHTFTGTNNLLLLLFTKNRCLDVV